MFYMRGTLDFLTLYKNVGLEWNIHLQGQLFLFKISPVTHNKHRDIYSTKIHKQSYYTKPIMEIIIQAVAPD